VNLKHTFLRPLAHAVYNRGPVSGFKAYLTVLREFKQYKRKASSTEDVEWHNFFPWPIDRFGSAGDAGMYFYQDTWCAGKLSAPSPAKHVDVGSSMMFLAMALQFSDVLYVDVRPLKITHPRFSFQGGDLASLPFASQSVESISSLSVVEHVGLGRYGDSIDPKGADKACAELSRILAPNGNLYVAVPTAAKSSTHFNAHRIFAPDHFIAKFPGLTLVDENYGLDDRIVCRSEYDGIGQPYAYGCFQFTNV
jgi:SAM-dependent methyltransferase